MHANPVKKWLGLVVLSLALAIIIIDTTLLNVSLSTLIRELNTDIQKLQWVITAYALMLAALTITGGRLGDLFGRKKMFMLGAFIFAVGSMTASLSHSVTALLWGESIIEGVGAALMMPATASLLVANFEGHDRAIAFGVWGGIAAASSAVGPLLGGYLTTHYSWRWGFRINVAVAALLLAGATWLIRESIDEREKHTLDWIGVLLSAAGLLGIVYGIIESSTYGWWHAKQLFEIGSRVFDLNGISVVPFMILYGLIFLYFFILWELRVEAKGKTPLVSMSLFKNGRFTSGTLTTMVLSLGMSGMVFALPVFFQGVRHLDALHTGLALLPTSLAILVAAPMTAVLGKKIPSKYLIQFGLLVGAAAFFTLYAMLNVNTTATQLIPGLLMLGFGMGLVMAPISNMTMSAVPVSMAGEAAGVNNTLRQVGASFGAAVVGAVLLTTLTAQFSSGVQASNVIPEQMKPQIVSAVSSPTSNAEFGELPVSGRVPVYIQTELSSIGASATTAGNKQALLYAGSFMVLGFLVSFGLPKSVALHEPKSIAGDGTGEGDDSDEGDGTATAPAEQPVTEPQRGQRAPVV